MTIDGITILLVLALPAQTADSRGKHPRFISSRIEDRVVKQFDFDEESIGNYDTMPVNWRRVSAPGHPRFLEPAFDHEVGHDAPPSFRFSLAGGSLACEYLARDISIHPNCDYLVSAWIRPRRIRFARAYVTAYFLDHALQRIPGAERRSESVLGPSEEAPWSRVAFVLPGGQERARWIGMSLHLEQPAAADHGEENPRPILHEDVNGEAWFDDITILRLPHVTLRTQAPGGVFDEAQPVRLHARIADLDGNGLSTRFELRDAEGAIVTAHPVDVAPVHEKGQVLDLGDLAVGHYAASLAALVDGQQVAIRKISLVRLGAGIPRVAGDDAKGNDGARGVGIILDPTTCGEMETTRHLLELLAPAAVKVPLWRKGMDDAAVVLGDPRLEGLIRALRAVRSRIVGVLEAPPPSLATQFGHKDHDLLDVLSASPDRWRPYLAFILARYGEEITAWQIGGDDVPWSADRSALRDAVHNVEAELAPLVGRPQLVVPRHAEWLHDEDSGGADVASIYVPDQFSAARMTAQTHAASDKAAATRWMTVEAPSAKRTGRTARLAEFARRLVAARQTGAELVFARQPWRVIRDENHGDFRPSEWLDETFFALRTIGAALGGMEPRGAVSLAEGVTAHLFGPQGKNVQAGEHGALVVWADGAGPKPLTIVTDAMPAARHYDLWERPLTAPEVSDGREFSVTEMPSVMLPVDVGRVRTLGSFRLDAPETTVQVQPHRRTLRLRNHHPGRLAGVLHLSGPAGWSVSPARVKLDLSPHEKKSISVELRFPMNQPVGRFELLGRLHNDEQEAADLVFRTPVEVTSPGLDVNVMTRVESGRLHIVQRITNATGRALDLRSVVIYPDLRRDSGLVRQLADGASAVREYSIDRLEQLRALPIRVSAETLDGRLRCHRIVTIE